MVSKEQLIEKIQKLPAEVIKEVDDFVDFLVDKIKKGKIDWGRIKLLRDRIEEADFNDYLKGLKEYEEMLASGRVKWK